MTTKRIETMHDAHQIDIFSSLDKIINKETEEQTKDQAIGVKLERPPNHIVFIESPKFLNGPNPLWPDQYIILRDFFELLCPICNDIERIRRKNDVPREEQVLFEYNVCPKCGTRKADLIDALNFYYSFNGVIGMRSGKTTTVAAMLAAHTADVLLIDNVCEKLGLVKTQALEGTFVAAASEQASDTIWGQFKGMYDASPWYQSYKFQLQEIEKRGISLGPGMPRIKPGDLYWETDSSVEWVHKRLKLKSVSTNASTQAGRTRIFAAIDELAKLDSGESKHSATEVYRVLENSLFTVRNAVANLRKQGNVEMPEGIMFSISSPLFKTDKSMSILEDAKIDRRIYGVKKATWEFNPTTKRDDFSAIYARDPIGAERDFGANPPGAENPFITDDNWIRQCIDYDRKSVFGLKEVYFDMETENARDKIIYNFLKIDVIGMTHNTLNEYVIHADPGEMHDSFCIAMGHLDENEVCIIDGAIEIRPIPKGNKEGLEPRSVHFPSATNIILGISRKVQLSVVTYDRWNSIEQIHRLIDNGTTSIGQNLNRDDHINFLGGLRSRQVSLPSPEVDVLDPSKIRNVPCAKAIYELSKLNDNGVKVDHPPYGSNDMIQCYIGVYRALKHGDTLHFRKVKRGGGINKMRRPPLGIPVKLRR